MYEFVSGAGTRESVGGDTLVVSIIESEAGCEPHSFFYRRVKIEKFMGDLFALSAGQ